MKNPTTLEMEGDRALVISRVFNGPPRIVFAAWTQPELVARWWAPASLGTRIKTCTADVRVGGSYRYALAHRDGTEVAFNGTYSEVTPHSRLAYTSRFEPFPDEAQVRVTFEDLGERTRVVSVETYPTAEIRKMVIDSGMEVGMRDAMNQLEALVESLAAAR